MARTTIQHRREEALAAYLAAQREAREALAALTRYLDGHQECATPDEINWGHVGDVRRIVAALGALDPA
jgi:hypothetical protein